MSKEVYTTYEISKKCHVDVSTVTNWINSGKIKAYKTPGGHRRVTKKALDEFMKEYNMPTVDAKKSFKILIVDDDVKIVGFLKKLFSKKIPGVKLEQAYDGYEAGKKIAIFKPDLIILDIMLPGINGYKILDDVVKSDEDTEVICISGAGDPELEERVLFSGALKFFSKPFDSQELVDTVAAVNKY